MSEYFNLTNVPGSMHLFLLTPTASPHLLEAFHLFLTASCKYRVTLCEKSVLFVGTEKSIIKAQYTDEKCFNRQRVNINHPLAYLCSSTLSFHPRTLLTTPYTSLHFSLIRLNVYISLLVSVVPNSVHLSSLGTLTQPHTDNGKGLMLRLVTSYTQRSTLFLSIFFTSVCCL